MRRNRQKHSYTHICLAYLISSKQQPCSPAGSPSPVIMNICGVWLCTWDECVHECQTCVLLDHELLSLDGIKGAVLWKKMIVFVKLLSHVKLHHGSDFRPIHMKHNNCKDNFNDYIAPPQHRIRSRIVPIYIKLFANPMQSPDLNQIIHDMCSKVPIWIKWFAIRARKFDLN